MAVFRKSTSHSDGSDAEESTGEMPIHWARRGTHSRRSSCTNRNALSTLHTHTPAHPPTAPPPHLSPPYSMTTSAISMAIDAASGSTASPRLREEKSSRRTSGVMAGCVCARSRRLSAPFCSAVITAL